MNKIILSLIPLLFYISCTSSTDKPDKKVPKTLVSKGDKVSVYYKGSYPDGTVFDKRQKPNSPMTFVAGAGMMIPGFDKAILGMRLNEEKKVTVTPVDAYGEYRKGLLKVVKKEQLRKGFTPRIGERIRYPDGKGNYRLFPVTKIDSDNITLDLNHPMAGKTLIFYVQINKIE